MGRVAEEAVARLGEERRETLRQLLNLTSEQCQIKVESYGRPQGINRMLRNITAHELDHYQHLQRLMTARGQHLSEAQLLLLKAQAMRAEVEVMALSLSDEEFNRPGPNEGDWSAAQVLEHLGEMERRYRSEILSGLKAA